MNFSNRIRFAGALTMIGLVGFTGQLMARENMVTSSHKDVVLKTTATGCQPAVAAIDLDINNVRARLMTGGDMWWNIGLEVAAYQVPKGSGKSSQFAASCWIGGYDKQGQLKVAAQTYRQDGNDYWPGALDNNGKIKAEECANWDKFWKIDKSTVNKFVELVKSGGNTSASNFDVINTWPARGNTNVVGATGNTIDLDPKNTYAPFVDVDNNGLYSPAAGDYPAITGDQYIWWVVNDAGNVKQQSQTASMGIEVQNSAFAYATQDFLNNSTFYNYRVINRGALTIDSTYIAVWDDCDLGYYKDDFIGCDTARGLGIMYNGTSADGEAAGFPVNSYGANPPQVGVDFFQGPKRAKKVNGRDTVVTLKMTNFTYFNNDNSSIGNPTNGVQIYNYMTGSIRNGDRFTNDFQGPGINSKGYGSGPTTNFVFNGDPGDKTTWSECTCGNAAADRRFIFSSGPFQLLPGAANDITFGCIWASGVGGCPNTDFKTIKSIDDNAQGLFEAGFKTVEGPEAPRMVVRELDKKLVFYILNDYGSNNYAESYGRTDGKYNDSLRYHQLVTKAKALDNVTDTLYRFEGYRVFQLANSQITSAEIFDPITGQVDNTKAYEVFQCDITNGVKNIINYSKATSVSDSTWIPAIKVDGKDSGLKHSFVINQDQFAPSTDRSLVNYHNYYFVAIAYGYNNFAPFSSKNYNSTQDQPYIGSAHGTGGINIPVVEGMPNPSNGAMGTTLNTDYGRGIAITRIEGLGNGGNFVELSDETTNEILHSDANAVGAVKYKENQGPIGVKVIDPVKIPAYDWVFQITGKMYPGTNALYTGTIDSTSGWQLTARDGNNVVETIYSERDIHLLNEQIIEKYGISISVNQVKAPGVEQANGNGYIDSKITFDDPSQPWLWGVTDQADSNFANWYRSGNNQKFAPPSDEVKAPCNFNDDRKLDTMLAYLNMLANFNPAKNSWAPYYLAAYWVNGHKGSGTQCGFEFAYDKLVQRSDKMIQLNDVNVVFTSDKSLWTKCAVIEMQEDSNLAEGKAPKFGLRRHAGWLGETDAYGAPVYSSNTSDRGTSYFPGYAIDQVTGRRLNIVFGEDSYLSSTDKKMTWYPDSRLFNPFDGSIIFGGKFAVYVLGTKYDGCDSFKTLVKTGISTNISAAYSYMRWVGVPTINPSSRLKSLADGIIPTTTTLRFRVKRPYAPFAATDTAGLFNAIPGKAAFPYYTFSTKDYAPTPLNSNTDKQALLDRIKPVPNPYYGYSGYESSRYDTKVKIINLPAKATVVIYALDGTLVRTLTKSDPSTSFLDWDIRNAAGLPVSSGMYLMHVKAEGIGETVLKWFGAMRPIDATSN